MIQLANEEKYWLRLPDSGRQYDFVDFSEVSDFLMQWVGNKPPFERGASAKFALVCSEFPDTSPIEIYVGDEDADPIRAITNAEILVLNYDVFGWTG